MANGWTVTVREFAAVFGNWCNGFVKAGFAGREDNILFDVAMDLSKLVYVH